MVGFGRRRGSIVIVARGGIGQVGQDVVVKEGRTRAWLDVFGRDHHVVVQKGHGQLEVPFEAVVRIRLESSGRVRRGARGRRRECIIVMCARRIMNALLNTWNAVCMRRVDAMHVDRETQERIARTLVQQVLPQLGALSVLRGRIFRQIDLDLPKSTPLVVVLRAAPVHRQQQER